MLGKLFGRGNDNPIPGDHFGLGSLCERHGLSKKAREVVEASRNAVEIRLAEFDCQLAHTASRVGGHPALPDDTPWPLSMDGEPLLFLAQLSCGELATERYEGLPDEGLISIFLDTMSTEPEEAKVFYHSLAKDMRRRPPPNASSTEKMAYRPTFHAITTVPRPDSLAYEILKLNDLERELYADLLDNLDETLDSSALQLGGHPPYRLGKEAVPPVDDGNWEFFLAVHDIEELFVSWPEGGCAFVWLPPLDTRFRRGRAALTWQVTDSDPDWEDEEDWDDDDDEDWEDE